MCINFSFLDSHDSTKIRYIFELYHLKIIIMIFNEFYWYYEIGMIIRSLYNYDPFAIILTDIRYK